MMNEKLTTFLENNFNQYVREINTYAGDAIQAYNEAQENHTIHQELDAFMYYIEAMGARKVAEIVSYGWDIDDSGEKTRGFWVEANYFAFDLNNFATSAYDCADLMEDEDGRAAAVAAILKIDSDSAYNAAVEWQNWQSMRSLSYEDVAAAQAFFQELAKEHPELKEEFEENGII